MDIYYRHRRWAARRQLTRRGEASWMMRNNEINCFKSSPAYLTFYSIKIRVQRILTFYYFEVIAYSRKVSRFPINIPIFLLFLSLYHNSNDRYFLANLNVSNIRYRKKKEERNIPKLKRKKNNYQKRYATVYDFDYLTSSN